MWPSRNARRMAEVAAQLTDHVLPQLPVRQWVLSLSKRLRPHLHYDPEVAGAVLTIFVRALRSTLREASPRAARGAEIAAVSFPQRFGGSLNPHFHFHFHARRGRSPLRGSGRQRPGALPRSQSTHARALGEPGAHRPAPRASRLPPARAADEDTVSDMLSWQASGGFSVDGSVRVEGEDGAGLERLVRYCARGPLALERLHALGGQEPLASPNARLLYRLDLRAQPLPARAHHSHRAA